MTDISMLVLPILVIATLVLPVVAYAEGYRKGRREMSESLMNYYQALYREPHG